MPDKGEVIEEGCKPNEKPPVLGVEVDDTTVVPKLNPPALDDTGARLFPPVDSEGPDVVETGLNVKPPVAAVLVGIVDVPNVKPPVEALLVETDDPNVKPPVEALLVEIDDPNVKPPAGELAETAEVPNEKPEEVIAGAADVKPNVNPLATLVPGSAVLTGLVEIPNTGVDVLGVEDKVPNVKPPIPAACEIPLDNVFVTVEDETPNPPSEVCPGD